MWKTRLEQPRPCLVEGRLRPPLPHRRVLRTDRRRPQWVYWYDGLFRLEGNGGIRGPPQKAPSWP